MSKRKPHNQDAGYIAEKIFKPSGSHIVIYRSDAAELDVHGDRYAVVCSKHATLVGTCNLPDARDLMKFPEFCEACIAEELRSINNPIFRNAVLKSLRRSPFQS